MKHVSSKSSQKKTKKKQNKRNGAARTVGTVIAVVIVLIIALSVFGALRCTTILPNVRVYGGEVGGMSKQEAQSAISSRLEASDSGVRLSFIGGAVMELTRSDTISDYDAEAAAEAAWNHGRRNGKVIPLRFALSVATLSPILAANVALSISFNLMPSAITESSRFPFSCFFVGFNFGISIPPFPQIFSLITCFCLLCSV